MAPMNPSREPQYASDYDDRTTAAVKSVLIEIGQILGSFKGRFAIVGGAVPWLLLANDEMPHVGTLDLDLGLDAEALGEGEYATLIEALQSHGYAQRDGLRRFQLVRAVPARDGGAAIDVVVDFLMPRDANIVKNVPPWSAASPCNARMAPNWRCGSTSSWPWPDRCRKEVRTASKSRCAPYPPCWR